METVAIEPVFQAALGLSFAFFEQGKRPPQIFCNILPALLRYTGGSDEKDFCKIERGAAIDVSESGELVMKPE